MKPLHLILLLGMNCLWAAAYSAFKVLSPVLDSGALTTLRFGFATLILMLLWPWLPGAAPRGRDLIRTVVMGLVVFVCAPRLQVAGVQAGNATDAAVLMALDPLIASVGAAIVLKEHIGPRRWVGFMLGMSGVVLMAEVWRPNFHLPGLAANALILLSFFCETTYSLIGKPMFPRVGLFKILAVALISGTLMNLSLDAGSAFHAARTLPPSAWAMLAYLTLICTVLGYALWFIVIREAEVNVAALTVFMQPVVGVIIAMAWLGETLRWGQLWGSLVIVAGLVIGLSRQVRHAAVSPN